MPHNEDVYQGTPGGPAGMTIEEFCRAQGLSRSRVDRTARLVGWRALAEQEGTSVREAKDIGLKSIRLEPTVKEGLRVRSPTGNERFSYEVASPEVFFDHLAEEHGTGLLTSRDVRRLLRYARLLRDAANRKGYYWLIPEGDSEEKTIDRERIVSEVEVLLRKVGWDPEEKDPPPSSSQEPS